MADIQNILDSMREIGAVRFRRRWCVIGVANLKKHNMRGMAMITKRKRLPYFVVVGKHLPADGPLVTETLIHETLHIAFPKKKEREIEEAAHLVAKVLRRAEKAKKETCHER
jgi:hypothetical protein